MKVSLQKKKKNVHTFILRLLTTCYLGQIYFFLFGFYLTRMASVVMKNLFFNGKTVSSKEPWMKTLNITIVYIQTN